MGVIEVQGWRQESFWEVPFVERLEWVRSSR